MCFNVGLLYGFFHGDYAWSGYAWDSWDFIRFPEKKPASAFWSGSLLFSKLAVRGDLSCDSIGRYVLKETLDVVKSMYDIYNGTGMQMALFFACLIYLFFQKKEKEKRFLFLGYTLLFFLICFFPVTAKIIMEVCIGKSV